MDLQLTGKVALVTAATRGLGRACALALSAEGMKVAVASRNERALAELADEIHAGPGEALVVPMDLGAPGAVESGVTRVLDTWGRIDVMVANAPGPPWGSVEQITVEQWRQALQINVLSMVRLTRAVLPTMKAQRSGRIFYVTTVGVRVAQPQMVLSNATRLTVLGLAKTLALEMAGDGILVNVLAPGPIATDRMEELFEQTAAGMGISLEQAREMWIREVPLRRLGRPEDLACLVALLASERCSFVTGSVIAVDGGKSPAY